MWRREHKRLADTCSPFMNREGLLKRYGAKARLGDKFLVQQQWLPTIIAFKLLETSTFGDFLNQCSETVHPRAVIETLDDVMKDYLKLDLIGYDVYDPKSVGQANINLMRAILWSSSISFSRFPPIIWKNFDLWRNLG